MGAVMKKALPLLSVLACLPGAARTPTTRFGAESGAQTRAGQAAVQKAVPRINGGLPSVSPDGQHIAFVSNRGGSDDLFVIAPGGTGELQLTHTPEEKGSLAWTAAGQIVFSVFAGDSSRLFAIDQDGRNQRQIASVPGRAPTLSPDGTSLLYMAGTWTATRLTVSGVDGLNARQITDGSSIAWNNHWSPDGKLIAFTGRETPDGELAVYVMNSDGSSRRRVSSIAPEEGGAQWPVWSPDGRGLAIQVNSRKAATSHIWIVDLPTGRALKLASHDQPYLDETPSWFPDGAHIAFQSNRTGRMEVWIMNADGSGARQVTGLPQGTALPPSLTFGGAPRVSPDGSRILFTSNRTGRSQVYVMNDDGSGVRQLTSESEGVFSPNWSPNGKRIVCGTDSSTGKNRIIVMNADGTGRRTISEAKGHQAPSWSPDGHKILFATGQFPNINIYTMDLNGAHISGISPNPGFDYDPVWSPDGARIAFVSTIRGQGPRIWVMNADGTGRKRLTSSDEAEEGPAWSSDSRYLAFQSSRRGSASHEAYVHSVDISTGADRKLGSHAQPYLDETPSWFPGGKRIAFQSNRTGRMEIWIMDAGGSGQRQLTGIQ